MQEIPPRAHEELQALYQRLAEELDPYRGVCEACGRCCHFSARDQVLFVTGLEFAEMLWPGAALDAALLEAGSCPFLRGKRCGIREHRALGCRIYYCERAGEEERNRLYEGYLSKLRAIEAAHGIEPCYTSLLEAFAAGAARAARAARAAGAEGEEVFSGEPRA